MAKDNSKCTPNNAANLEKEIVHTSLELWEQKRQLKEELLKYKFTWTGWIGLYDSRCQDPDQSDRLIHELKNVDANIWKAYGKCVYLYFKTQYDSRNIQEIMQKCPLNKANDNGMNPTIPDSLQAGSSTDLGQSINAITRENNDQFAVQAASEQLSHGNAKNNDL